MVLNALTSPAGEIERLVWNLNDFVYWILHVAPWENRFLNLCDFVDLNCSDHI